LLATVKRIVTTSLGIGEKTSVPSYLKLKKYLSCNPTCNWKNLGCNLACNSKISVAILLATVKRIVTTSLAIREKTSVPPYLKLKKYLSCNPLATGKISVATLLATMKIIVTTSLITEENMTSISFKTKKILAVTLLVTKKKSQL
jgi:hypothetical protein